VCDIILNTWKMLFQALDVKESNILDLLDNDLQSIEPSYSKGGLWLKHFSHSNLLCTRATRAIINHAPIGEYQLCFFPKNSSIHANYTQSKLIVIFSMNVEDISIIGTQDIIQLDT